MNFRRFISSLQLDLDLGAPPVCSVKGALLRWSQNGGEKVVVVHVYTHFFTSDNKTTWIQGFEWITTSCCWKDLTTESFGDEKQKATKSLLFLSHNLRDENTNSFFFFFYNERNVLYKIHPRCSIPSHSRTWRLPFYSLRIFCVHEISFCAKFVTYKVLFLSFRETLCDIWQFGPNWSLSFFKFQ